jgi:hypothetical protein
VASGRAILGAVAEKHAFRSVIEGARGGGAVAQIPADVTKALGGLKQLRVFGTVNGVAYKSSTMPYRGAFYLGVHKATREAAGVEIGEEVEVEITRDDSPRVLELAPELEAEFKGDSALRARFEALSFSRRRELADPIREAVKPETRQARLARALEQLRG